MPVTECLPIAMGLRETFLLLAFYECIEWNIFTRVWGLEYFTDIIISVKLVFEISVACRFSVTRSCLYIFYFMEKAERPNVPELLPILRNFFITKRMSSGFLIMI